MHDAEFLKMRALAAEEGAPVAVGLGGKDAALTNHDCSSLASL
jgi:hypothetical protein